MVKFLHLNSLGDPIVELNGNQMEQAKIREDSFNWKTLDILNTMKISFNTIKDTSGIVKLNHFKKSFIDWMIQ